MTAKGGRVMFSSWALSDLSKGGRVGERWMCSPWRWLKWKWQFGHCVVLHFGITMWSAWNAVIALHIIEMQSILSRKLWTLTTEETANISLVLSRRLHVLSCCVDKVGWMQCSKVCCSVSWFCGSEVPRRKRWRRAPSGYGEQAVTHLICMMCVPVFLYAELRDLKVTIPSSTHNCILSILHYYTT